MNIYETSILTQIKDSMLIDEKEEKVRTSFWPSESEKPLFDLYHSWLGTPVTNPIDAEKLVMFSAAKMLEMALVKKLQDIGLAKKFDNDEQLHIEFNYKQIKVSGYCDGIFIDGTPFEIKTIYGDYQAKELRAGKPRTSYLKQLAIYMYALKQEKGKLIYLDRGTGEMFEFTLTNDGGTRFSCINVKFDLIEVFDRWVNLYTNYVLKRLEPKPDALYKYPVGEIDWSKIPKAKISAARNGYAVIGDWQVLYSQYKNLYVKAQGTCLGYSPEELKIIKEKTAGYSKK